MKTRRFNPSFRETSFISPGSTHRRAACLMTAALSAALLLSGCSPKLSAGPELPEGGTLQVGNILTVSNEIEPLELRDYNDALAADGLYYASWSSGDAEDYINEDGDEVSLYDAQLYLIAGEFQSADKAEENRSAWYSAAAEAYLDVETSSVTIDGVEYDILQYTCSETSPYARGISAFAVSGLYAICAEFTCRSSYEEDLEPTLTAFLESIIYQ